MSAAPLPANEAERLRALRDYDILDSAPEPMFDDLTRLAAHVCGTPISLISLVDEDRQWFKSRVGLAVTETPREQAFCAHAILADQLLEVPNALADGRFADNPLVLGDPNIRFYAGSPLRTPDGRALGTLCVIDRQARELTEAQRDALRTLSHQVMTQIELRRHIRQLQDVMLERARVDAERREVQKLKDEFVATVSHELRTPLTSIKGSLGLLAGGSAGALPDEARDVLAIAERNTTRLIALVNDILDLEHVTTQGIVLTFVHVSAAGLIARAMEAVGGFARQHDVRLARQGDDGPVWGDEHRLLQVLINLVSNAIKFSPAGATVTMAAAARHDGVEFRVRDTGRGIPPAMREAIFERFRQVDVSDSRQKGGTGLGLAICKAIVEHHGGRIGVDSEEGRGSTFWFRLPSKP